MAREIQVLSSSQPTAIAPAKVNIAHVQLRDLIICPRQAGVVNYVQQKTIVEHDLRNPDSAPRPLATLSFTPNSLTYLPVNNNDILIAAGGQDAEIHLSLHTPSSATASSHPASSSSSSSQKGSTRKVWDFEDRPPGSINNSVFLSSLSLTRSNQSSLEPRVGISNNDATVRLYDVPMRVRNSGRKLLEVGKVGFDVPINHSSISPDGRTLISVGDSNKVYFHHMSGGSYITFTPIMTLTIPAPITPPSSPIAYYTSPALAASFSTAFSRDGSKFAVASQEGVVAVWDVRCTSRPLKTFQSERVRSAGLGAGGRGVGAGSSSTYDATGTLHGGNGGASDWLSDDPWEWTRGTKAPGWCVRSVKFNTAHEQADVGGRGREVMVFSEHTSLIHIVDARTFETDEVIRVPTINKAHGARLIHHSRTNSASAAETSRRPSATTTNATNAATGTSTTRSGARPSRSGSGPVFASVLDRADPDARRRSIMDVLDSIRHSDPVVLPPPQPQLAVTQTRPRTPRVPPGDSSASIGSGNANANATGRGDGRSTADILRALDDAFRIPMPSTPPSRSSISPSNTAGPSGVTQPQSPTSPTGTRSALGAIPAPVPIQTTSRSVSSGSSGSGSGRSNSAYSPPASIGDSTWRTLGGGSWAPGRGWSAANSATSAGASAGMSMTANAAASGSGSTRGTTVLERTSAVRDTPYVVGHTRQRDEEEQREREREREVEHRERERQREREWEIERDRLYNEMMAQRERERDMDMEHHGDVDVDAEGEIDVDVDEGEQQSILLIPDLGDRQLSREVRALLNGAAEGAGRARSRSASRDRHDEEGEEWVSGYSSWEQWGVGGSVEGREIELGNLNFERDFGQWFNPDIPPTTTTATTTSMGGPRIISTGTNGRGPLTREERRRVVVVESSSDEDEPGPSDAGLRRWRRRRGQMGPGAGGGSGASRYPVYTVPMTVDDDNAEERDNLRRFVAALQPDDAMDVDSDSMSEGGVRVAPAPRNTAAGDMDEDCIFVDGENDPLPTILRVPGNGNGNAVGDNEEEEETEFDLLDDANVYHAGGPPQFLIRGRSPDSAPSSPDDDFGFGPSSDVFRPAFSPPPPTSSSSSRRVRMSIPKEAANYGTTHPSVSASSNVYGPAHTHAHGFGYGYNYGYGYGPAYGYHEDLDIGGVCFDPRGEKMYVVGSTGDEFGAVVEWNVRGAEKRWWVDDGWR